MTRYKVSNEDLKRLAELYNSDGKRAVYKTIRNDYHVKNPTDIFKRMASHPELSYSHEKDRFETKRTSHSEDVFMSMEDLCSPVVSQHVVEKQDSEIDSRPAAMDKLIRELIGDRLLELNKYVKIDSLSKRIIINQSTLNQDGYRLFTQ